MSRQDLLQELFEKFLDDKKLTPAEIRQLQALVQDERNSALLDQLLASLYEEEASEPVATESNARAAFEEVWAKLQSPATIADAPGVVDLQHRRRWWKYAAAAAVVLAVGTGVYWLTRREPAQPVVQQTLPPETGIQPGGNKAILVLADGSRIVLDSAANGLLVQQGSVQVVKSGAGELEYRNPESRIQNPVIAFNTLATPRGGRYMLTLPDGSKVWLNAASSIRYPTSFTGKERKVEITGEAYFEVEKNAAMPFRVIADQTQIEVLGTRFNVMAYTDEETMKTTLMEGRVSVKLEAGSRKPDPASQASDLRLQTSVILKPGQQAQIINNQLSVIKDADTEAAVAWKNGLIQFEGGDIRAAMRMIARWYDVEVEYRGNVPSVHFRGTIPSNVPVSEVLDMLGKTEEVHFSISGRKIIVTP